MSAEGQGSLVALSTTPARMHMRTLALEGIRTVAHPAAGVTAGHAHASPPIPLALLDSCLTSGSSCSALLRSQVSRSSTASTAFPFCCSDNKCMSKYMGWYVRLGSATSLAAAACHLTQSLVKVGTRPALLLYGGGLGHASARGWHPALYVMHHVHE